MSTEAKDLRAIVYPTLWAPIMLKGVPRDWAFFCLGIWIFVILIAGFAGLPFPQLIGLFVAALFMVGGWIAAMFDPEFFSIVLVNMFKIRKTKGSKGGNYHVA